jgi:general secretion pathway protein D
MRAVFKTCAIAGLVLALSAPVEAAKQKTWKVNLKDADISALVSEVAEVTGKNFVIDPRVKGTITVVSSKELNASQLYELFLSVLGVNGFAAVQNGNLIKVVPDVNAKQMAIPVDADMRSHGETLITRVIPLENANATDLVPVLRPMMPQFAHLAAIQSVNALVISDRANNVDAIMQIIAQLDGVEGQQVEVLPLKETRVDDMVAMLESLAGSPGATPNQPKSGQQFFRVKIVADSRSNRLLLKGTEQGRKQLRELVETLDAPSERLGGVKVIRLRHASAKQVAEVLKGLVANEPSKASPAGTAVSVNAGGVSLIADETLNALVVRADPALMKEVMSVVDQLDQRRSQVLIQAAIVEVSGDDARQLGVQWASGDPTKGVGLINFSTAGASLTQLGGAYLANNAAAAGIGDGAALALGKSKVNAAGDRTFYGALIQALTTVTNANLLSTPSIMTLDNQEAKIVVGQNVPFITGTTTSASTTTTNPFQTIERQDVGITLKVVPHIGEGGAIRLEIEQEVSAVQPATTGVRSADLITSKRSIKTTVLADDGQTIVLGGLIQDDTKRTVSKVPLLGDIPLLGYLFRSTRDTKTKQNLLVFLQPTLLRDGNGAAALSQQQYEAMRTLDMAVSKNGKISRLPEKVEAIYQGYHPAGSAPAEKKAVEAEKPVETTTP